MNIINQNTMKRNFIFLFALMFYFSAFSQVKTAAQWPAKTDFRDSTFFEKAPRLFHMSTVASQTVLGVTSTGIVVKTTTASSPTRLDSLRLNLVTTYNGVPIYIAVFKSDKTIQQSKIRGLFKLKSDTIPFATFGAGSGLVADSAAMQTGMILGSFYNKSSDTLVVVESRTFMVHGIGLDTMTIQGYFNTTFSTGGATLLTSSVMPIGKVTGTNTALTTGNVVTSFTNSKIPPGYIFWEVGNFPNVTRKPQFISCTLSVYKK